MRRAVLCGETRKERLQANASGVAAALELALE